jgi:hypothetical protein
MISKIANLNNTKKGFLKYTLYRIHTMKTQLIVLLICGVLSFPLLAFSLSLDLHAQKIAQEGGVPYTGGTEGFIIISLFLAGVSAVVVGLITYAGGFNCYDYFNKREKVDKMLSLPVTHRQRFWGDFVSGLAPITLTYILSAGIGLLIMHIGFPKDTFLYSPQIVPMIVATLFAGLLTLFSVFIIGVFCAVICGRAYESIVYPALIFGIIPAIIALFGNMVFFHTWQVYVHEQLSTVLSGTSPFGFFIGFARELGWITRYTENIAAHFTFLKPAIIIPFVLINAGFLTGAYYLAKRRGAEKTGQSFVFNPALTIILSLVVFCITAVFTIFFQNQDITLALVFGLFACTAIAFLVLDVSAKRGFKKMGTAGLKYICMLTGSLVVSNLLIASDGFGIGKNVPAQDKIESAQINLRFLDNMHIDSYLRFSDLAFTFTEKESVEVIRQLNIESNNDPLNSSKHNRDMIFWGGSEGSWRHMLPITYTLKNGNTVNRNVILSEAQIESMLPLVMSDEYKAAQLNSLENWLRMAEGTVTSSAWVSSLVGDRHTQFVTATADVMSIYEAFKKDYLAETTEQRFYSKDTVFGSLSVVFEENRTTPDGRHLIMYDSRSTQLYVLAHYTNLIAELERQGLDVWNGAGEMENVIMPPTFMIRFNDYVGVNDMTASGYGDSILVHYGEDNSENQRAEELIRILAEVGQPSYFLNSAGYTLGIYGGMAVSLVIPPEYNEIARELYNIAWRARQAQGWYRSDYWHDSFDSYWEGDYAA